MTTPSSAAALLSAHPLHVGKLKMNKIPRLIQLTVVMILLTGCSQNKIPKWLSGEWTFDAEATMENLSQSGSGESVDLSAGLRGSLVPMLNGMEMTFSEDDLIIAFQGKRSLKEIEIYESKADLITIKQSDGDLMDFHKSENGFWTLSDDGQMKMFFERKDPQP
jgi:hypothetical protein